MSGQTANQHYHLILADIAMAAAIRTYDHDLTSGAVEPGYTPGALRDRWLARTTNTLLRRQVTAMANAAVASLQSLPAERLEATARNYGIPVDGDLATRMADHFADKRDAMLTYRR